MATKSASKPKSIKQPNQSPTTDVQDAGAAVDDDSVPQFHEFGLDDRLVQAIAKLGWREPTLVQARAIPLGLDGKDVLARARTGSGKTAAFLIPMLHKILQTKRAASSFAVNRHRQATEIGENNLHATNTGFLSLILLPSKELCKQATNNIRELLSCCMLGDVTYADLSAQTSEQAQKAALAQRPDVIVATPAKILHYLSTETIDLKSTLNFLIVDEADLMFSFGYETEMNAIMQFLPKICQVMMTSATLSEDVIKLKRLLLHNAVVLRLEESQLPDVEHLSQYHIKCATEDDKFLILCTLFKLGLIFGKSIIFVNTVDRCYKVKLFLQQFGIRSCTLNSELPVNSRSHIIEQFNDGVYSTLVASDEQSLLPKTSVKNSMQAKQRGKTNTAKNAEKSGKTDAGEKNADEAVNGNESMLKKSNSTMKHGSKRVSDKEFGVSRGVDFRHVSNIINFDFPLSANAYIHRVGRTARGDSKGTALSFVLESKEQMDLLKHVEETLEMLFSRATETKKVTDSTIPADRPRSVFKPYHFRMDQVEGFRYRTTDALRAVTKVAIREARLREIRSELLASQKLRSYFEANPREFKMLRHDRELHTVQQQPELRHVPEYLVPPMLKATAEQAAAATNGGGNKKKLAAVGNKKRKTGKPSAGNPLKTFKFEGLAHVVQKEQAKKGGKRRKNVAGKKSKKPKTG